jgi:hypothetical protein
MPKGDFLPAGFSHRGFYQSALGVSALCLSLRRQQLLAKTAG